jgi:L-alanine-DL-glutamate epimerase-like enolase superfamily enzyme
MKIRAIQVKHLRIPLQVRFAQSNNATSTSDSLMVILRMESGALGYGECCPRTYVTGESIETVIKDVQRFQEQWRERSFSSFGEIRTFVVQELAPSVGNASCCGIEMALLDAWSKESGIELPLAFGASDKMEGKYAGVIPMQSPEALPRFLEKIQVFEFADLKMKVGRDLEDTLAKIKLIRSYFPEANVRLDVNCAWEEDDAFQQIPVFQEVGVGQFEQLFEPHRQAAFQRVTRAFGKDVRITVDESITTLTSAQRLIRQEVANHFNLKISKHGGVFRTLEIYETIQAAGLECQLGAHFGETSLLTAAGLLINSLAPQLTALEGGYGTLLLEKDICAESLQFGRDTRIQLGADYWKKGGWGVEVEQAPFYSVVSRV